MNKTLTTIVKELSEHVLPMAPAMDKARIIYDWMIKNIEYDYERAKAVDETKDYETYPAEEVLERGKGICSDMAVLYVELAREMGLKADYAFVDVDCFGKDTYHACAVVDLQTKQLQVDPAYRQFDVRHQRFTIREPCLKKDLQKKEHDLKRHLPVLRRKWGILRYAAAGIAMTYGICSYFSSATGASAPRHEGITLLELDTGTRFVSQNGVFRLHYDKETGQAMKEYVFFCEAKEGALPDQKILDRYLLADKDNNGIISPQEAQEALSAAKEAYSKKKN
jgi:hypothetical protein